MYVTYLEHEADEHNIVKLVWSKSLVHKAEAYARSYQFRSANTRTRVLKPISWLIAQRTMASSFITATIWFSINASNQAVRLCRFVPKHGNRHNYPWLFFELVMLFILFPKLIHAPLPANDQLWTP